MKEIKEIPDNLKVGDRILFTRYEGQRDGLHWIAIIRSIKEDRYEVEWKSLKSSLVKDDGFMRKGKREDWMLYRLSKEKEEDISMMCDI